MNNDTPRDGDRIDRDTWSTNSNNELVDKHGQTREGWHGTKKVDGSTVTDRPTGS